MERECQSALALAKALEKLPGIYAVNYPDLDSIPYSKLVQRQMDSGMGGAILTFRTGSKARAFAFIDHLQCAYIISNISDVRTLAVHPMSSIFIHSDKAE